MQYEKWIRSWKSALAENFFLRSLSLLMAISLIITSYYSVRRPQRVLVIPPQVTKDFWTEESRVSPELIEQTATFISIMAGNLSPANADYNINTLIKYYLANPDRREIVEELQGQAAYIKKNNITQTFFPSMVTVDESRMQASVEGVAATSIGNVKTSQDKVSFKMRFKARNYRLWVEELYMEQAKSKKEKDKNKDKEEDRGKSAENKED